MDNPALFLNQCRIASGANKELAVRTKPGKSDSFSKAPRGSAGLFKMKSANVAKRGLISFFQVFSSVDPFGRLSPFVRCSFLQVCDLLSVVFTSSGRILRLPCVASFFCQISAPLFSNFVPLFMLFCAHPFNQLYAPPPFFLQLRLPLARSMPHLFQRFALALPGCLSSLLLP